MIDSKVQQVLESISLILLKLVAASILPAAPFALLHRCERLKLGHQLNHLLNCELIGHIPLWNESHKLTRPDYASVALIQLHEVLFGRNVSSHEAGLRWNVLR